MLRYHLFYLNTESFIWNGKLCILPKVYVKQQTFIKTIITYCHVRQNSQLQIKLHNCMLFFTKNLPVSFFLFRHQVLQYPANCSNLVLLPDPCSVWIIVYNCVLFLRNRMELVYFQVSTVAQSCSVGTDVAGFSKLCTWHDVLLSSGFFCAEFKTL